MLLFTNYAVVVPCDGRSFDFPLHVKKKMSSLDGFRAADNLNHLFGGAVTWGVLSSVMLTSPCNCIHKEQPDQVDLAFRLISKYSEKGRGVLTGNQSSTM